MAIETVAVTGANGFIGQRTLVELNEAGYTTVNLARGKQREEVSDRYFTTDLTSAGEVYGSLARSKADAVIHLGTLPTPTNHPGYVTYGNNVMSSYHVLEAASSLGLESVVLPSSINAMGCAFQDEPMEVEYVPVDEDHPLTPRDPYAIAKQVIEVTGAGFGRQTAPPRTISTFRFPWVRSEEELRTTLVESDRTLPAARDNLTYGHDQLFTYLHVDDAARACRLAIEADFTGHEVFWLGATDTTVDAPTSTIAEEFYPEAEIRGSFADDDPILDTSKAKRILGWEAEWSWQDQ